MTKSFDLIRVILPPELPGGGHSFAASPMVLPFPAIETIGAWPIVTHAA
jgi:hypothetical protein